MGRPRRPVREPLAPVLRQKSDHRPRKGAPAHVGKRRRVDNVVPVSGPEQRKEVQPALRKRRAEPGESMVADLRANAVRRLVPGPGVIDRDPPRRLQGGPQNVTRLGREPLLAPVEKPDNLPFRDVHPDIAQQTHQAGNGDLAAVILGQHETPQLRPEVTADPRRQRRHHHPAIWGQPALAPVAHHMGTQDQVLNHVVLVTLEARAVRDLGLDDSILVDGQPRKLAATALALAVRRLRIGALVHAGRLDRRRPLQSLQARDLFAQRRVLFPQTSGLFQ